MKEIQPNLPDLTLQGRLTELRPSLSEHIERATTRWRQQRRRSKGKLMGKTTIAELGVKIDEQTKAFDRLLTAFEEHVKQDRVVEISVEKLKASDASRQFHVRALWTALSSAVAAFLVSKLP